MSECQTKAGNQNFLSHSHSLSLSLTLSHSFTLLFTHSRHAEQLLFSCLCSKVTLSLSHSLSHTLTLLHSCTLALSHSLIHSFTHSRHAEQLLFSCLCSEVTIFGKNCNVVFWTATSPSPVSFGFIELVPS